MVQIVGRTPNKGDPPFSCPRISVLALPVEYPLCGLPTYGWRAKLGGGVVCVCNFVAGRVDSELSALAGARAGRTFHGDLAGV